MRFKNDGPVRLYVVVDTWTGEVVDTFTNQQHARNYVRANGVAAVGDERTGTLKLLTYDQRGTR